MSYRGRYQLGQTVPLFLLTLNAGKIPSVPDDPPAMKIWTGGTMVKNQAMPVRERYTHSGLFYFDLFLDGAFSAGQYVEVYYYKIGSHYGLATDNFEVVPGGSGDGHVLSAYFYSRPHADFIVHQMESGKIKRGRGPSLD